MGNNKILGSDKEFFHRKIFVGLTLISCSLFNVLVGGWLFGNEAVESNVK